MKKIFTLFLTAVIMTGCLKSKMTNDNSFFTFDWKTTKTVPVNVVSENNGVQAIYIYDEDSKLLAAGYTPFSERITVPTSCEKMTVTTSKIPAEQMKKSSTKADTRSFTFVAGDGITVTVPALNDLHAYLYTEWEARELIGQSWNDFVAWWNLSGGSQGQSSITLYSDKEPKMVDGKLFIYHTCLWENCDCSAEEDTDDYFDNDKDKNTVSYTKEGTYIFEDLFPSLGDFDMNDCVIEEVRKITVAKDNSIERCQIALKINALGCSSKIGAAVNLISVNHQSIDEIEMFIIGADGQKVPYTCPSTGTFKVEDCIEEDTKNKETIIPISNDLLSLFGKAPQSYLNTSLNGATAEPITILIDIEFHSSNIKLEYFETDIFIMPKIGDTSDEAQRGHEIHVPYAPYTSKMNTSLFGQGDDNTTDMSGTTFKARNGYVWGIYMPIKNFRHSFEKVRISDAYPEFNGWINSNGQQNKTWYNNPNSDKTWKW